MSESPQYLEYSYQGNTRRKFLQEQLLMQEHNLLCYSCNLLMAEPKRGYEYEWRGAKEKMQLITQMLNEMPDSHGGCIFYGRVQQWVETDKGYFVCFEVCSPERSVTHAAIVQYFKITEDSYREWIKKYEKEMESRRTEDVPTLLKANVKKGCIYTLEWENQWD